MLLAEDPSYFSGLLKQCGKSKNLQQADNLRLQITRSRFAHNKFLNNLLIETYGKCGDIKQAKQIFDTIHEPNNYSWNIMLSAYAQNGHLHEASLLLERMPDRDVYAYTTMVTGYAKAGQVQEAREVFDRMPERNHISWNALFSAYAHKGHLLQARAIFDGMPEKSTVSYTTMFAAYSKAGDIQRAKEIFDLLPVKDTVAWNVMISAYTKAGCIDEARMVFNSMPDPDVVSWTEMLTAYSSSSRLDCAKDIFDRMPVRDPIAWTAMVSAYAGSGAYAHATVLFKTMDLEGIEMNKVAFVSVLDACTSVSLGRILHSEAAVCGLETEVEVATSLVYMYGKFGKACEAELVFRGFPISKRDVVMWNAMITVYTRLLKNERALEVFQEMTVEGAFPDRVTFIGVLTACSHAGKLEESWSQFVSMRRDYGLVAWKEHFICMSDVLARSGKVEEAEELLRVMPHRCDVASWLGVLSACITQDDAQRGERAAQQIVELQPGNPSSYVLLANLYSGDNLSHL